MRLKNIPRLRLADLLRRRKMALEQFMSEFGITTYEGLVIRCARMGVLPPSEHEVASLFPAGPPVAAAVVNNPPEGVIVLEPIDSVGESAVAAAEELFESDTAALEQPVKKPRKKKEPVLGA